MLFFSPLGVPCEILSIENDVIKCQTREAPPSLLDNGDLYPGETSQRLSFNVLSFAHDHIPLLFIMNITIDATNHIKFNSDTRTFPRLQCVCHIDVQCKLKPLVKRLEHRPSLQLCCLNV